MKRRINLILLVGVLILNSLTAPNQAWGSTNNHPEAAAAEGQGSGMPGWPIPDKPIPHHEPGQPARSGQASHQVTRLNAEGEEEVVELRGLDALLADGTITDPLQGNYRLVGLDKFMFSSYDFDAVTSGNDAVPSAKVESISAGACSPNADQVALYTDYDYLGQCVAKPIGRYPNAGSIGLNNDWISSVEVGSKAVAVLCEHEDYGGVCETFTGDDPNLGDNSIGNDAVSSVKVEPAPNNYSVESFEMEATGILDKVPNSNIDVGNFRFTEIAAGDLNGDLVEEQIVASAHPTITLRISELPGSWGRATSAPGVIAHPDGSLDVVVRGYDQALWHRHYDGVAWGEWDNNAGGLLLSAPAVASRASGELDVFAVGTDNQVYHTHWVSPTWTSWALVDGGGIFPDTLGSGPLPDVPAPAVVARGGGLDLFRLGPDNRLWWRDSGGTWENLGGMLASGPGAISLGSSMQVYALGLDGTLWHRTYAGGWGDWARLETPDGVAPHAVPVPALLPSGKVRVYLAGTENRIWSIPDNGDARGIQIGDRSTSGYAGQGLELDGIDDYVDLPDGFPYVTSFTFAAWVNWRGGDANQYIFDFGRDTDSHVSLRARVDGKPEFTITTESGPHEILTAPDVLPEDTWVHVAVTLDDTTDTGVLYIDGSAVDTQTITLTPQDVVGQNTWLGRSQYSTDPAFNGKLDEVAVFDRALDANEISALVGSGWDGMSGLLMGLHLEETPAFHGTTLVDASGQGNDGTLYTQETVAGIGAAGSHLLAQTSDGSLHSLEASEWVRLDGLDVAQSFETGAVTRPLYADSAIENIILDITTGHFSGDGRQQVVLAYETAGDDLRLEVYDIQAGFGLTKIAELAVPIPGRWPRIAAGDVDGDGVDEIGLAYTPDYEHYQVKVYQIEKVNEDWTGNLIKIGESDPMGASDGEGPLYRAGTLRIESGNVVNDDDIPGDDIHTPNDEFVVLADFQGGWRRLEAQLYIYDHEDVPTPPVETKYIVATDQIYWAHTDVTGLGLGVGNVDGSGLEEIVVTWPRGFEGNDWPNLERDLVVWSADDGTFAVDTSYVMPHFSPLSFLETLAVGDLDQDLEDEIILATATGRPGVSDVDYALELYEFETLSDGPEHEYPLSFATIPRAFNLEMGDFTGESLRVGRPTYRLQNRVDSLVAVINMPPKHRDYVKVDDGGGKYHYELVEVRADTNTFAQHATSTDVESSTETKNQRDWAIGAGLDAKAEGFGYSVDLSLEYSYGENFERTQGKIKSSYFEEMMTADITDMIAYFGTPYKIWEYPLYALGTQEPIDYISVIWPAPENDTTPMADTIEGDWPAEPWYRAGHQTYNVWSYDPLDEVRFPDYDPDREILDSTHGAGKWGFKFSEGETGWVITSTTKTHDFSAELGFGAKGGFFGGLVKYDMRAHVKGSYDQADIETDKQEITESTDIRGELAGISSYRFKTRVIGYWAQGGHLALDYQTDMAKADWNPTYADPDPAFILPWAGFPYGDDPVPPTTGLERFSPEVQVVPQSASVGETVTISATVRNFSNYTAYDVKVRFCQGDPGPRCEPPNGEAYIDEKNIAELNRDQGPVTVAVDWQASGTGKQKIYAVLDPDNTIDPEVHDEDDLINNNVAYGHIKIGGAAIVDHGLASELPYQRFSYDQGAGWTVAAYVPPGNLSEVVHFELRDAGLSVSDTVGKPFELVAYAGEAFGPDPDYEFPLKPAATDPPAVITIDYDGANPTDFDEDNLKLYRKEGSTWVEATCPDYKVVRFLEDKLIAVPICQTGTFVLSDGRPPTGLFLPLVTRN